MSEIALTENEKLSIVEQVRSTMNRSGKHQMVAMYSVEDQRVITIEQAKKYDPKKGVNRPQFTLDTRYDPMKPFVVIPRLRELRNWMIFPDKSTNIFLYSQDGLVQNLIRQYIAIVVGDGARITVYEEDLKSEDEEKTNYCRAWARRAGGKGKSINSYVIPWWIIDNMTTGFSVFSKYIGQDDDDLVDKGEMALVHLDPRLYTVVGSDNRLWRKIVVFPIRQANQPTTKTAFDQWNPAFRGIYAPFSSAGLTMFESPIMLQSNSYYDCTLFLGYAPISSIVSEMVSTIELRYYRNKAFEKTAFPVIFIRVARHSDRDQSDVAFLEKLDKAAAMGSELRTGDSIAVEGKEYDSEGSVLSEGWEVSVLDVKSPTLDFAQAFSLVDRQKAYGLGMSMGMLENEGQSGQKHSMTGGVNVNQNVAMGAKITRSNLRDKIVNVLLDLLFMKFNVELKYNQIDIQFSEIRETDVSAYSGVIFQSFDRSLIDFTESRQHLRKVGLNLEHKDEEELMEEAKERQMMLQGAEEGGIEGGIGAAPGEEEEEGVNGFEEDFPEVDDTDPFWSKLGRMFAEEEEEET